MDRLFLIALVPIVIVPAIFWIALKYSPLPTQTKKWAFAVLSALFAFIVIVPVPNFFILPMPNALAVLGYIMSPPAEGAQSLPEIYATTWKLTVPSFLITAAIFRAIAILAFKQKPLPNQQNQPI